MNDEVIDTITPDVDLSKHEARWTLSGKTAEGVAGNLSTEMLAQGYKLEVGTADNGVYGKGNKVMRILFGAFVKRFAFRVHVTNEGNATQLVFVKDGKGYAGGVIGVNQVKKEFSRLVEVIGSRI
jgi:hypothetical protein